MPVVDLGELGYAFVCNRNKPKRCKVAGCDRAADRECDYPVATRRSGTCDAAVCGAHATPVGDSRDHCPAHANQRSLF